jgi:hypothetical protein
MPKSRYRQPASVKFISCSLIAYAIYGVWIFARSLESSTGQASLPYHTLAALIPFLSILTGALVATGLNHGRILYLAGFLPIQLIWALLQNPPYIVVQIAAPILFAMLLITKTSNRHFSSRDTLQPPPPQSEKK